MDADINQFLEADEMKVKQLISNNPVSLTPQTVADFLGINVQSVRSIIENGRIGLSWRKDGKMNHGYVIPTTRFVRWYLNLSND